MKIIDAGHVSVTATFTEPTLNSDGSPLTDLAFCTVADSTDGTTTQVNASAPTGGGKQSVDITLAVPAGTSKTFSFDATATDTKGNISAPTAVLTVNVNRIVPNAPSSFTVA